MFQVNGEIINHLLTRCETLSLSHNIPTILLTQPFSFASPFPSKSPLSSSHPHHLMVLAHTIIFLYFKKSQKSSYSSFNCFAVCGNMEFVKFLTFHRISTEVHFRASPWEKLEMLSTCLKIRAILKNCSNSCQSQNSCHSQISCQFPRILPRHLPSG